MMNVEEFERIYLIIGPIFSIITILLNILAFFIFLKKEFEESKIYQYLSLNSLADALVYIVTILVPLSKCTHACYWSLNESYFLAMYEFYGAICLGTVVKTFSTYLNIAIAFYRVIEISRFKSLNRKCNVLYTSIVLLLLAALMTIPLFLMKTIVRVNNPRNNLFYTRQDNIIFINQTIFNNELKSAISSSRIIINLLYLSLVIIPNIIVLIFFKKQFKTRNLVKKLNSSQAHDLINEHAKRAGNGIKKISNYDNSTKQEIRLSAMVIMISFICVLDHAFKITSFYFSFKANEDSMKSKLGYFILHLSGSLYHSFSVLIFYFLNKNFRVHFLSFFNFKCFRKN